MPHHTDISVQIAPVGDGYFETRVIGAGGWRAAYRGISLSDARYEAWAFSNVLRCAIEDLSPEALRVDADGRADYLREQGS
jgi:hypothetical protein